MFTHELIHDSHKKEIDDAIDAALDEAKAVGVPREIAREHIATRAYRAPKAIGDNIARGDLIVDLQVPLVEGEVRYRPGSMAHRQVYVERTTTLVPGTAGDWLESNTVPTPLADAIKLILDPAGPESELRRRRAVVREEQRQVQERAHYDALERDKQQEAYRAAQAGRR